MEENIPTFVSITGVSPEVARRFIEFAGGDVGRAVELFYENPDLVSSIGSEPPPAPPASTRPNIGREDASGVIHIDSEDDDEDDDDIELAGDDNDSDDRVAAETAAAFAQEEEDAAMAKRLQEELYSENRGPGAGGPDDVRAPIARTTETLVASEPTWGPDSSLESSFLQQMRRNRPPPGMLSQAQFDRNSLLTCVYIAVRSGGPFSQQIWGNPNDRTPNPEVNGAHAQRLQDLFRPPYDLMAHVTWDEARAMGKEDKKWLLVNLQNMNDFNCQALNRDVWKHRSIVELVSENFIFLQYDKDYPDAQEYVTFYFPNQSHENPDNYPHVAIIDPRTGEQVKSWSGRPFPSTGEFHAELAEFLDRYSLAANSKNPVAKATAKKPQTVDVDRMTEDEMLEMALQNSLAGGQERASTATHSMHDPDALTKSPIRDEEQIDSSSKGKEPASVTIFHTISSSQPHTEPENNPSTTTRIQFRHSNGRVIRRFGLQEPVRRIYEWLKATPLEGKEGKEFELKQMPAGQDLIEKLDEPIGESGLKQGTVMIEFIEEE